MTSFPALLCFVALWLGSMMMRAGEQQAVEMRPGQVPPGFIELDGSKSPESIPDWTAWEGTLRLLADASGNSTSQFYAELQLSASERERVVKVALEQNDRDRACEQRMIALGDRLKGVDAARVQGMSEQELIRCRVESLQAADALLAALSPASARRLRRLVDEMRASTRVLVPREGLAHYRRPR